FSSRRRHTRFSRDWSSDVCSSDLGSGSQKKEITKIFEEAGMIDRVHFGGVVAQKNLPDYLRAADLYLSASFSDGSSVSLMEALRSEERRVGKDGRSGRRVRCGKR